MTDSKPARGSRRTPTTRKPAARRSSKSGAKSTASDDDKAAKATAAGASASKDSLTTTGQDSLSIETPDSIAASSPREEVTTPDAEVIPPSPSMTAADSVTESSMNSGTASDSLASTATVGDAAAPKEAAPRGGSSGNGGSGNGGSGKGGSGSGGRGGRSTPPPTPPAVRRRGWLLMGVVLGGALVVGGYILAVGTSDLWLGKVVSQESWNQLTQRVDNLAKTNGENAQALAAATSASKAASEAADAASKQVAALSKSMTERTAALDKSVNDLAKRNSEIAALGKTASDAQAAAKAAGSGISDLRSRIEALTKTVAAVAAAAGQSPDGLQALQKETAALKAQVAELAQKPSGADPDSLASKEALNQVQASVARAHKATADLRAEHEKALANQEAANKLSTVTLSGNAEAVAALRRLQDGQTETVNSLGAGILALRTKLDKVDEEIKALDRRPVVDPKALETAIAAVKQQSGALSSELAALKEQVDASGKSLTTLAAAVSAQAKQVSDAQAGIGGLKEAEAAGKAELAKLSDQVDGLGADLTTRIGKAIETALTKDSRPRAAALALASASLNDAVRRGGNFQSEFNVVETLAGSDAALQEDLTSLKPLAAAGVSTQGGLLSSFRAQAPKILAASRGTESSEGSFFDGALESLSSMVEIRPVGELPGNTPDAVVARAEQRLLAGNLDAAVTEVASLTGAAATAAAPWLTEARARLLALQASSRLEQAALASLAATQN
ncbi:MAG: hypothetical protein Kilf2KO_06830 [Rhodospirillales bacterium]